MASGKTITLTVAGLAQVGVADPGANIASVIIPFDGWLVSASMSLLYETTTISHELFVELSFSGQFKGFNNDQMSTILVLCAGTFVVTSGGEVAVETSNQFGSIASPGIQVQAGDRIYLNQLATVSQVFNATATVTLTEGKITPRIQARARS